MTPKKILCIGDTHLPFFKTSVFTRLESEVIPALRPDVIIQMGDLFDQFAQKKFPGKLINPQDEFIEARVMAEEFWRIIQKRAPKAKCMQIKGNHDMRAYKRLMEKCPELLPFFNDSKPYQFNGVETVDDVRDEIIIDNIFFTHGHKSKLKDHLVDVQYMHNVVIGHLHTAQIHYERVGALNGVTRWAACAGYLADPFHDSLVYRPLKKYFTWTHGVLLIEEGSPKFIPLGEKDV